MDSLKSCGVYPPYLFISTVGFSNRIVLCIKKRPAHLRKQSPFLLLITVSKRLDLAGGIWHYNFHQHYFILLKISNQ
jgi:hypothetical protein